MQACCTGASGSEEERLKQEYLNSLRASSAIPNTSAKQMNDNSSNEGRSDLSSNSKSATPRRMKKRSDNYEDESGGKGDSGGNKSQKGGALSSRQASNLSDQLSISKGGSKTGGGTSSHQRKSSRHDQLRELVGEIVSNMGYDGIPIVRIKGNKYLIGTEVQYL